MECDHKKLLSQKCGYNYNNYISGTEKSHVNGGGYFYCREVKILI